MFTTYKIKKYYLKDYDKGFVKIMATIFKYRFGFMVDIIDEELDSNYKCRFEENRHFYYIQVPIIKKEAKIIINILNKK